jgi:DNA (cytosine-5)-methyltransferase 1
MALKKIRFIDLFSGIGGMILAFEAVAGSLNMETECLLSGQINADAQLVYQYRVGR